MNFYKRCYQPILRYLYSEAIKRQGEISLHKLFKYELLINVAINMSSHLSTPLFKQITKIQDAVKETSHGTTHHLVKMSQQTLAKSF